MTDTAASLAIAHMSDSELADAYDAGRLTIAEVDREYARREVAERRAATIAARQSAWHDAAHAQYLAAVAATNGYLLSRAGLAAVDAGKLRGEFDLWRASERDAERYASEELREYFYATPRLTRGQYAREVAASKRAELEQHRAESGRPRRRLARVTVADTAREVAREVARQAAATVARSVAHAVTPDAASVAREVARAAARELAAPPRAVAPVAPLVTVPRGAIARYSRALDLHTRQVERMTARLAGARKGLAR